MEFADFTPAILQLGMITTFDTSYQKSQVQAMFKVSAKTLLSQYTGLAVSSLSFGQAHIATEGRNAGTFLISSDNREGVTTESEGKVSSHHLLFLCQQDLRSSAVINGCAELDASAGDLKWVTESIAAVGLSTGEMLLYVVDSTLAEPFRNIQSYALHTDNVCEIGVNPSNPAHLVTGSYDGSVAVSDLSLGLAKDSVIATGRFDLVPSSVKWSSFQPNVLHCCLEDNANQSSIFRAFDVRTGFKTPLLSQRVNRPELYCSEQIDANYTLLGLDGGEICQLDMRRTDSLVNSVTDPRCDSVGGIGYRHPTSKFLVHGLTDFTVWNHDKTGIIPGEATVIGSSQADRSKVLNSRGYIVYATWLNDNVVLTSDSDGCLTSYKLE